jgi:GT2 family glycosyltransferase
MPDAPPTLTIVIPTYERRAALARLLAGLAPQLAGLRDRVDVLVVVDGSRDGSAELVAALDYPVAVAAVTQPNAGLAAARNRGLADAAGDVVWFLDDDMVPGAGLVERHLGAHVRPGARLLMGPCLPPAEVRMVAIVREWAAFQYGELERAGRVTRAEYFSAANTSAFASTWRAAGGFDDAFLGWGGEDYELAVRLLASGHRIDYDAAAVAWHHQERDVRGFCATKRAEGRNTVRIVDRHPATLDELLPARAPSRRRRAARELGRGGPRAYAALATLLATAAAALERTGGSRARRALALAAEASFLAGVAEADAGGRYLGRLLGEPPDRARRASATDSSQPSTRPTGSQ